MLHSKRAGAAEKAVMELWQDGGNLHGYLSPESLSRLTLQKVIQYKIKYGINFHDWQMAKYDPQLPSPHSFAYIMTLIWTVAEF